MDAALATGKLHSSAASSDDLFAAQLEASVAAGDAASTLRLLSEKPHDHPADPDLLLVACEHGHAALVECLVRNGAPIEPGQAALAPLQVAAKNGHATAAKVLLDARAEPSAADKLGLTALHRACERGHTETARLLLEAGAFASQSRDNGTTPLYLAAREGHAPTVALLLAHGADAEACMMPVRNAEAGVAPLYAACGQGHAEVAAMLLQAGARVDRPNTLGATALHVACGNGHAAAAKVLLGAGAAPDLPGGRNGSRPLLAATEKGHTDCVELLVEAHADPTWRCAARAPATLLLAPRPI